MTEMLNDWADGDVASMLADWGMPANTLDGAELLVASYTYEDYSGAAFVLFRKDDKLFEVNGSHCSCYGLSEGDRYGGSSSQWEPEETTAEALAQRDFHYEGPGVAEAVAKALSA